MSAPAPSDTERPVRSITTGPHGYEGEGFPVVRAFAGVSAADLDPFVHMDQMGEVEYQPGEPKGTDWHPHRGFETVTYMIDGRFAHQDSHGGGGLITDGATQWMTAGSGILHIETPARRTRRERRRVPRHPAVGEPAAQGQVRDAEVPGHRGQPGEAAVVRRRRIVGAHHRRRDRHQHWIRCRRRGPGPATYTPITLAHATIEPGARLNLPWDRDFNALVYVLSGRGAVGPVGHPIHQGQLAVLGPGDRISVAAEPTQDSHRPTLEVLILGGKPIREPVFHYGPFVMNSKSELIQALEDFKAGKFGTVPPNALMPHTSALRSRDQ